MIWVFFIVFILIALTIDLGVFNRTPHVINFTEALIGSVVWVLVAFLFTGIVYMAFKNGWVENPTDLTPQTAVMKYITGYLIELSLSVDNIFVIALVFTSFGIPRQFRHEVLFYGILGAVIFRALMIFFGVTLINRFSFMVYIFGAFLLYTAVKMMFHKHEEYNPKDSRIYRWFSKFYPITHEVTSKHFFVHIDGVKTATPLLLALIIIEFTDILFAVDSIPAILGITTDPFLVFTSNILAVLGLRSMFFLISGILVKFTFINYSLAAILAFVGVEMLLPPRLDPPEWVSLIVIVVSLAGGILASIIFKKDEPKPVSS